MKNKPCLSLIGWLFIFQPRSSLGLSAVSTFESIYVGVLFTEGVPSFALNQERIQPFPTKRGPIPTPVVGAPLTEGPSDAQMKANFCARPEALAFQLSCNLGALHAETQHVKVPNADELVSIRAFVRLFG